MAEGRHGVILYSAQTDQGTAVAPATAAGICGYEVDLAAGGGVVAIATLGKAGPHELREDVIQTDFSISDLHLQTSALIGKAARSGGVLPWLTFGFGRDPDSGSSDIWQIQDCKIHQFSGQVGQSGPIVVSLSGVGGLKTDLTTGAAAHLTPKTKMAYDAVLTRDGSAWEFLEFSWQVANTVRVQHVGHGEAASNNRLWSYQDEGALRITGSITRRESCEVDLQAALQTAKDIVLLITDSGATSDITLTFTGVKFGTEQRRNAPDDQETFVTPWEALSWSVS